MKLTVMSYNTQHCLNYRTRKIDFDMVAGTIQKYGADIVGLQEIRNESAAEDYEDQARILAEKLGYHYYFAEAIRFQGVNPYGNALLSRYPIIAAETILIPDPNPPKFNGYYETRCFIKATVQVGGGLRLLVSHFGLNPDEQENAVRAIVPHIAPKRCVLMGDFNVVPEDPVLLPIRQRLYDTAESFAAPRLSYPSDVPEVKIDYIFTSRDLPVTYADIPEIISSDHRPHIASIELD